MRKTISWGNLLMLEIDNYTTKQESTEFNFQVLMLIPSLKCKRLSWASRKGAPNVWSQSAAYSLNYLWYFMYWKMAVVRFSIMFTVFLRN